MDEFPTASGHWWFPDEVTTQLFGNLKDHEVGAELEVVHSTMGPPDISQRSARTVQAIHGVLATGKCATLLNCVEIASSWNSQVSSKKFVAQHLLIGDQDLTPISDELRFSGLRVQWPDLRNWFRMTGLAVAWDTTVIDGFDIRFRRPQSVSARLGHGLSVEFAVAPRSIPVGGFGSGPITGDEVLWLEIRCDEARELPALLSVLEDLKQFFAISMAAYTSPSSIEVRLPPAFDIRVGGNWVSSHARLYAGDSFPKSERSWPHLSEFVLPYSCIASDFERVLVGWSETTARSAPAASLYHTAIFGPIRYRDLALILLVQAAELFHRTSYAGTYVSKPQFKQDVVAPLKAALTDNLDPNVRDVFAQKLYFLNEYTLRDRLMHMAEKHTSLLKRLLPDFESEVRRAANTRNSVTHRGTSGYNASAPIRDLSRSVDTVRLILELEFLAAAGVELDQLHESAAKSQTYLRRYSTWRDDG